MSGEKNEVTKVDVRELTIQNLMRHEDNRKFINELLQYCRTHGNIFNSDPYQHAYNAGLRAAGEHIENEIKTVAPAEYLKMIGEDLND